jgi:AraC-like DNA-binding protein
LFYIEDFNIFMHHPVKNPTPSGFGVEGVALDVFQCVFTEVRNWGRPALRNTFWRCYLPVSGDAKVCSTKKTWQLREKQGIVIPPECPVWGEATSPFVLYFAHFNCSMRVSHPTPATFAVDENIRTALDQAVAGHDSLSFKTQMLLLVSDAIASVPVIKLRPPSTNQKIRQAYHLMKENLNRKLKNEQIARHLRVSEASLLRLFRETVGSSPQKEHLRLRLNHAAELLQNTSQSIEQIAAECGFWDRNHFTRVFTREWKTPPARYRNERSQV